MDTFEWKNISSLAIHVLREIHDAKERDQESSDDDEGEEDNEDDKRDDGANLDHEGDDKEGDDENYDDDEGNEDNKDDKEKEENNGAQDGYEDDEDGRWPPKTSDVEGAIPTLSMKRKTTGFQGNQSKEARLHV